MNKARLRCREMPRAVSRDEKGLFGRNWIGPSLLGTLFVRKHHQPSMRGGVSTVCESPAAHCIVASMLKRRPFLLLHTLSGQSKEQDDDSMHSRCFSMLGLDFVNLEFEMRMLMRSEHHYGVDDS